MAVEKPPKLIEIIIAGCCSDLWFNTDKLVQLQFKFEDGIESPLIDAENTSVDADTTTYTISDIPIGSIVMRVNRSHLHQLKLKDRYGIDLIATKLHNSDGKEKEILIPDHHVIVGFYGSLRREVETRSRITSLGFIVMDVSPWQQ